MQNDLYGRLGFWGFLLFLWAFVRMAWKPIVLIALVGTILILTGCGTIARKNDEMVKPVARISMSSGSYGSAVAFFSGGGKTLLISNNHVTVGEEWLRAEINGGVFDATVVKSDADIDLSIIEIETEVPFVADFHSVSDLRAFDEVYIVGAGLGQVPYPSKGIISIPDMERGIQFSGGVVIGSSGGCVFRKHDGHYQCIGIVYGGRIVRAPMSSFPVMVPVPNIGFATSMEATLTFINEKNLP